jgi:hypothetical protein
MYEMYVHMYVFIYVLYVYTVQETFIDFSAHSSYITARVPLPYMARTG